MNIIILILRWEGHSVLYFATIDLEGGKPGVHWVKWFVIINIKSLDLYLRHVLKIIKLKIGRRNV